MATSDERPVSQGHHADVQSLWFNDLPSPDQDSFALAEESLGQGPQPRPTFVAITSESEPAPPLANSIRDMPTLTNPAQPQDDDLMTNNSTTGHENAQFEFGASWPFLNSAQETAFHDDLPDSQSFDHGPYVDFGFMNFPDQDCMSHDDLFATDLDLGQSLSGAPVLTFLDARSSPEPNEGQPLRFDDYLGKTFAARPHLRRPTGSVAARREKDQLSTTEAFSDLLSSTSDHAIWERENLAHVEELPPKIYHQIVSNFEALNEPNERNTRFAMGDFPSIAACNAFMQLYFEMFDPVFPMLHRPTFDPAQESWLLVLAIIAMGCRFSQCSAAVDCVDILQEFTRRAFYHTVEEEYAATYEPWLLCAGLLNQIGMQCSKNLRLTEAAQSMRSLLASIARKVNCFNESTHPEITLESQHAGVDTWRSWIRKERKRRLAYTIWLADSQFVLFLDMPPIVPMDLPRVRLPCPEELWQAHDAVSWLEAFRKAGTYRALDLRQELTNLYLSRRRSDDLGDYAVLLLMLGVYRDALDYRRTCQEGFGLRMNNRRNPEQESLPGTRQAMEYLQILVPHAEVTPRSAPLKSVLVHHFHMMGMVLGIAHRELWCHAGYRVTSIDIARCQKRLQTWAQQRGKETRQVAFHAGQVFAEIRHSSMHGYYEGRALMTACLYLWIYGVNAVLEAGSNGQTKGGQETTLAASAFRLDRRHGKQAEQSWVEDDSASRHPYLAGVGSILGATGVSRLIQEGSRILCANSTWPLCQAMGKALEIFHKVRSEAGT